MRNRLMLLIIFKDAIATRNTNNLLKILLATLPSPKTTSLLAFALIVDNAGAITTVKFALQMEKKCNNCCITGHFESKCRKMKKSQTQTLKHPQSNANQIDTTVENVMMKNLSIILQATTTL